MKASKFVVALASMLLLASCGETPASSASGLSISSSSSVKKTMDFLQNGQYYISVPEDVVAPVDPQTPRPRIIINGIAVQGGRYDNLGGKFELEASGAFANDIYVTVAYSEQENHIAVKVYGAIEKEHLNDVFPNITGAIGVPNKLFICFSTRPATWDHGLDPEMDQQIQDVWDGRQN